MDAVREFSREDIGQVTSLWLKVFRQSAAPAAKSLQDYFREMFFESPWADAELPSLVYEQGGRGIVGFLGVLPRWMTFKGQRIRIAVASQLMVHPHALGYPAVKLMRAYFAGKQDLSFSDGANSDAEKLWRACGGHVGLLYSLHWTRILRPAAYARTVLKKRGTWAYALAAHALGPVCHAFDAVAARTGPGSRWFPYPADELIEDNPSDETLFECVRRLSGTRSLAPEYTLDSFRWLLRRAEEKKMYGKLNAAVVREPGGNVAGWYLYYLQRDGVSEVLQFGARPNTVGRVLNCLSYQAWKQGAVAVSGELDPAFTKELALNRCLFRWPGYAVLVKSRTPEIVDAIHRGDAFLTRLEGEWWPRFSDPDWVRAEPETGTMTEEASQPQVALPIHFR